MKVLRCLSLLVLLLAGCGVPSTVNPALTPEAYPTGISIPSETNVPTQTPIPLPPGILMMFDNNELRGIYPGTPGVKSLMPADEFARVFPTQGLLYAFLRVSPDGTKALVILCADQRGGYCQNRSILYIGTVDGTHVVKFENKFKGGLIKWAPTSDQVLIQWSPADEKKQIISAREDTFGQVTELPSSSAAFWSYDGKKVYYYNSGFFVVNNDGSGNASLQCDLCAFAGSPTAFAVQQSPDGEHLAVGYIDGTIIVASPDLSYLKMGQLGAYISRVLWSPDSQKVAVDVNTSTTQSDVFVVGLDARVIAQLPRPDVAKYMLTCSWSPDSRWVNYLTLQKHGYCVYIQELDQPAPSKITDWTTEVDFCPVWLP